MILDLAAAVSAGAGIAGIVLALRYFLGERLPKWTIPAAIGAAIIGFSVWSEYSWYPRVAGALPPEAPIVLAPADPSPLRPWTYFIPLTTRFVALDRTVMVTSVENPAIRRAEAMVVQRWNSTKRVPMGFDCARGLQVTLAPGATLSPDGTLSGGQWITVGDTDAMQKAACREG
ncbi:MAG: hypothetical protein ACK4GO_16690 [Gemmobacter sp.]